MKNKKEGLKDVKTGSLGIGDAYAYGVKELLQDSRGNQGSNQDSWLGTPKQTIDAKECVDRLKLNHKGNK